MFRLPLLIDGEPSAVAGWKFWMTVKHAATDADADAVIRKSTDLGDIVTHDANSVRVVGLPEDTKEEDLGKYEGDFQGQSPEGEIFTLETYFFHIDPEITITPSP